MRPLTHECLSWYHATPQGPTTAGNSNSMHPTPRLPLTLPTHLSRISQIRLPPRNLRSLDGTQLLGPSLRRLDLLHGAQLIRGVARDADVVVAFEDELQVADLEGGGGA